MPASSPAKGRLPTATAVLHSHVALAHVLSRLPRTRHCNRQAGYISLQRFSSVNTPIAPARLLLPIPQGAAIERFAQMTDWSYYEAARRFQRVLVAAGIDAALKARGVMVRRVGARTAGLPGRRTGAADALPRRRHRPDGSRCCIAPSAAPPGRMLVGPRAAAQLWQGESGGAAHSLAKGRRHPTYSGCLCPNCPHPSPTPPQSTSFPTQPLTHPNPLQSPQDGDTVVIGDLEFEYSSDHSEAGMYERWYSERRAAGVVGKGQARWPHVTG